MPQKKTAEIKSELLRNRYMLEFDFEKFSGFYHSHIEPQLFDLEKERKKIYWYFFILDSIFILTIIIFIILFILFWFFRDFVHLNDEQVIVLWVGIPFSLLIFLFLIHGLVDDFFIKKQKKYIRSLKTKAYKKIFKLFDLEYSKSTSPEFVDYQNTVLKYISKDKKINIKIFTYIMRFEDEISGIFKDIPFKLCDATIIKQHKIKCEVDKGETPIFQGLMLAVKLNKIFDKETVIKTDNFNLFNIKKNLVKLEDNEFNKRFKVYADNEVEARYIITPSFMERLKNFHKNKKDKTIIFFDSKCSESKNMYVLTNTGKDNFEIPFNKSILNEKYYYNLLKELVDMLEIAVALKLEQNIGL